jgi:integrase
MTRCSPTKMSEPKKETGERAVYNSDPSTPIDWWKEAWEAAKQRAGVEVRFHDLRHTATTRSLDAGVDHGTAC